MAAEDAEKTEMPTARRLSQAREEGNVPKTGELNSAVVLLTGTILLYITMGRLIDGILMFFMVLWGEIPTFNFTVANLQQYMILGVLKLAKMLAPVLLAIMVMGVIINIIQSGFLLTAKVLTPKLSKINPLNGIKRLFSIRGVVELFKNILKIGAVGIVVYWTIKSDFIEFIPLIDKGLGDIIAFLGKLIFKVALRTSLLILLIGILDFIWVKYKYIKDLKMTKQEVKDEAKQMEGPPEIRRKIRSLQLQTAMRRMMAEVPSAEVVITNPTHIAVALKYDQHKMDAPVVVAKGLRKIAERIKKIALENDIPIVENKPLAQALYKSIDIGFPISHEFFAAVAEILVFVYRLRDNKTQSHAEKYAA